MADELAHALANALLQMWPNDPLIARVVDAAAISDDEIEVVVDAGGQRELRLRACDKFTFSGDNILDVVTAILCGDRRLLGYVDDVPVFEITPGARKTEVGVAMFSRAGIFVRRPGRKAPIRGNRIYGNPADAISAFGVGMTKSGKGVMEIGDLGLALVGPLPWLPFGSTDRFGVRRLVAGPNVPGHVALRRIDREGYIGLGEDAVSLDAMDENASVVVRIDWRSRLAAFRVRFGPLASAGLWKIDVYGGDALVLSPPGHLFATAAMPVVPIWDELVEELGADRAAIFAKKEYLISAMFDDGTSIQGECESPGSGAAIIAPRGEIPIAREGVAATPIVFEFSDEAPTPPPSLDYRLVVDGMYRRSRLAWFADIWSFSLGMYWSAFPVQGGAAAIARDQGSAAAAISGAASLGEREKEWFTAAAVAASLAVEP